MQRVCQPRLMTAPPASAPVALAPLWHTRVLVSVLLLAPAAGLLVSGEVQLRSAAESQLVSSYLPLLLVSLGFAAYVSGLGLGQNFLPEWFGSRRLSSRQALREAGWGILMAAALLGFDLTLQQLAGAPESLAAHALMPRSTPARAAWLSVAACVGFAEELMYRGYLQRQLAAFTGRAWLGIVLQALLFGIAHGEQGSFIVLRFTLYGLLLGWMANWRRGLLAVTLGHIALDWYGGLSG